MNRGSSMVIDVEARAKKLGIDLKDYEEADSEITSSLFRYRGNETEEQFVDAIRGLQDKKLVALIRWNRLDLAYPDDFDWNGIKQ